MLRGLTWKEVLAYLDDVIVLGKSFEEHIDNLKVVLERFRKHNLKLKPRKCVFIQKEVTFLGRRVSEDGVSMTDEHIESVINWPKPTCTREL